MKELADIEIALLKEGYICIESLEAFKLYADTVGGGLDIIYQPKTRALYVCGRQGQLRIFPIEDPKVAILRSRELASRKIRNWVTGCTD